MRLLLLTPTHCAAAALSALVQLTAAAQPPLPTEVATIEVLGTADRLNVGQNGYCGARTEIDSPRNMSFDVPAGRRTWLYIMSKAPGVFEGARCAADYSFVPDAGRTYTIRFTRGSRKCLTEFYRAEPGESPRPSPLHVEEPRSCLFQ